MSRFENRLRLIEDGLLVDSKEASLARPFKQCESAVRLGSKDLEERLLAYLEHIKLEDIEQRQRLAATLRSEVQQLKTWKPPAFDPLPVRRVGHEHLEAVQAMIDEHTLCEREQLERCSSRTAAAAEVWRTGLSSRADDLRVTALATLVPLRQSVQEMGAACNAAEEEIRRRNVEPVVPPSPGENEARFRSLLVDCGKGVDELHGLAKSARANVEQCQRECGLASAEFLQLTEVATAKLQPAAGSAERMRALVDLSYDLELQCCGTVLRSNAAAIEGGSRNLELLRLLLHDLKPPASPPPPPSGPSEVKEKILALKMEAYELEQRLRAAADDPGAAAPQ